MPRQQTASMGRKISETKNPTKEEKETGKKCSEQVMTDNQQYV